jgi:preprotein translocase subunit SecA
MGEIIQHIFARRDVDAHVVPFLGRDLGEAALHLSSRPVFRDGQPVESREAVARRDELIERLASLPPARLADPARFSTASRSPLRTTRRERPVTSATTSVPKRYLSSRPVFRDGQPVESREAVARRDELIERLASLPVGERLVELHREGMGEIIQHIFARRDVDAHVVP